MRGPLAQTISMVGFGNAALSGQGVDFPEAHSTAQFCKRILFVQVHAGGDRSKEVQVAGNFLEWVDYLRGREVSILRLQYASTNDKRFSDRMTAGLVGGGGRWLIEAVRGEKSDVWEARWEVTDKGSKDKKIWSVAYGENEQDYPSPRVSMASVDNAHAALKSSLIRVLKFAQNHKAGKYWIGSFNLAIKCLGSGDPLSLVYHKDLLPKGRFDLKCQQILAAAQPGFVFGGMGSWNDLFFDGAQKEYERVSDELFATINSAIVSAVNLNSSKSETVKQGWCFWKHIKM